MLFEVKSIQVRVRVRVAGEWVRMIPKAVWTFGFMDFFAVDLLSCELICDETSD